MNTATIDMPCWWTISMNVCLSCTFANIVNVLNVVKQCQLELHRQKSVALTKTKTLPTERWKGLAVVYLEVSELCSERKIVYLSDRRIDAHSQRTKMCAWILSVIFWWIKFRLKKRDYGQDGGRAPRTTQQCLFTIPNQTIEAAWWNFEWYYNIMLDRSSWHIDGT